MQPLAIDVVTVGIVRGAGGDEYRSRANACHDQDAWLDGVRKAPENGLPQVRDA